MYVGPSRVNFENSFLSFIFYTRPPLFVMALKSSHAIISGAVMGSMTNLSSLPSSSLETTHSRFTPPLTWPSL
jgi:hypothetical protein